MAGVVSALQSILTQLQTIPDLQTVRVWNNQIKQIEDGKYVAVAFPACFVEFVNPINFQTIGVNYEAADLTVRLYLVHENYNQEGSFEQDLLIYGLKDKVINIMQRFEPDQCSALQRMTENQSFDHDNLYVYTIDFVTHILCSKGSAYDPDTTTYIQSTPPTNLEIDIQNVSSL